MCRQAVSPDGNGRRERIPNTTQKSKKDLRVNDGFIMLIMNA
jgi:hypothetical protein